MVLKPCSSEASAAAHLLNTSTTRSPKYTNANFAGGAIFRWKRKVLFCLLFFIPFFGLLAESVESRAETYRLIGQDSVSRATYAKVGSFIQIENFGRIDDHYFRGGQPENSDYADLAALGIRTVITLTSKDTDPLEKIMVEKAGMKYYEIPMHSHTPPTDSQVEEFLGVVNDPVRQPVYVHCAAGKHRTGVMTAIYRISKHGWTADQAYEEMKKYHFGPSLFHWRLKDYVYDYYRQSQVSLRLLTPSRDSSAAASSRTGAANKPVPF